MKWERGHQSSNVIDRRGGGAGGKIGLGVVGTIIAVLVSRWIGIDITPLLGGGGDGGGEPIPADQDADRELKEFVSFVFDDAQATWSKLLGPRWRDAKMVLFSDAVQTRCGHADSGVGPFYCGGDEMVYIDLRFYRLLDQKFGAPGDFAQAYVIAHEVGHHVQHLQGVFERTAAQARGDARREKELSIRQELQADCYAGVWAFHSKRKDLLEAGDLEEGLGAASAVGDDTLQKMATGKVQPETWTHGSSAQRMKWFRRGFDTGDVDGCDTFGVDAP
ncbi:MAG: zinc metallopeptidase [Deltaproteobacteria bacterium]|jgi:predicted metalloprotease|nr:zinc metallopeptidase [Deltaproteobacteria bacterium]